jgi:EmrB/QacA subfamily drug resistance transporter
MSATTSSRSPRLVLTVLCGADFLVTLDGLIVAVALPAVQDDIGLSGGSLQWTVTAYVLGFAGFLLLGGRLADLFGRRRLLLVGLALFAAGALAAGLARDTAVLVAGRAVQGVSAALMAAAALALLVATFPAGRDRTRALGWWSAAGSIGIPAGALLGGLLTASLGWRWVLLINVPAAALAAVGTRWAVSESTGRIAPRQLDVPGAVLATSGLALVVFGVSRAEHLGGSLGGVLVPLAAGLGMLAVFIAFERRVPAPLLPMAVLRRPGAMRANLAGAALPVGLGAVLFLATLHLQQVLEFTPLQTGLAYLALSVPIVAASPLASRLVTGIGARPVAVGGFLAQAAGLLLLARTPEQAAFLPDVLPAFVLVGLGAPAAFVPTTVVAMHGTDDPGVASGIFNTVQQIGNALALAALATLAAARADALIRAGATEPAALTGGHRAGFLLAAGVAVAGATAALRLDHRT